MRFRLFLLAAVLTLSGCSLFESRPDYTGPSDYAFTLRVGCFCPYVGPLRVTVEDSEVVDVRQLEPQDGHENTQDWIEEQAMTLEELDELVERARREADDVDVTYDPTYGFPADVYIDWIKDAVDDEIGYTVTDYSPL
ncbi:MAG: hypothetical protein Rubg2KO_19930 [Rubricoccaceae bacterium]